MSGMEMVGMGIGLLGTFAQAGAQRRAGREAAAAANFEAAQLDQRRKEQEINAQIEKTRADQTEARRTEDLVAQLETIQAIRAGRGGGLSSPTGTAILQSASEDERTDIGIERTGILQESDAWRRSAWNSGQESGMARRKAKYSMWAGNASSTVTILSGLGRAASSAGRF